MLQNLNDPNLSRNKNRMNKYVKYIIITPVRDEEKYLEYTLKSVFDQTIKPLEWVIINDGSTDNTGKIIDEFARRYPWIHPVHRENRGFRQAGGGVIEAFYDGYRALITNKWDFIVKLDGDLSFDADYFARCFDMFKQNVRLGIGGGVIESVVNGIKVLENHQLFHVRGATKIYRKECWDAIGGLLKAPGWDTLDEVKANMLGWKTQSFFDLKLTHYRPTGAADGTWKNYVKNGRANYISGYHPLFMFMKCIKRVIEKPYFIVSFGLLYGFIEGYIKRIPQVDDRELIRYLRKQQVNKLLFRKSIWN